MTYLSEKEKLKLGFKSLGENVSISDKASFYNPHMISIGNDVRIDDFVVISAGKGGIQFGNNIHIAVYSSLIGAGKIILEDFVNISSRVGIYSSSDDYSGEYMTNPTVPSQFTKIDTRDVVIRKHTIIGPGSIVLPGVIIEQGVAIGALSLVKDYCKAFTIFAGVPAKEIKKRSKNLVDMERKFKESRVS